MTGFGVFEHFKAHPNDVPYKVCPKCDGDVRMFKYARHIGEIAFYCPVCDWNTSVTDLNESMGYIQASNTEKIYLDGDNLVTLHEGGFAVVSDVSRVE